MIQKRNQQLLKKEKVQDHQKNKQQLLKNPKTKNHLPIIILKYLMKKNLQMISRKPQRQRKDQLNDQHQHQPKKLVQLQLKRKDKLRNHWAIIQTKIKWKKMIIILKMVCLIFLLSFLVLVFIFIYFYRSSFS